MRAQRLSHETAAAVAHPHGETPAAARVAALARVPAGLAAPLPYGHAPAQARQRRVVIATMLVAHAVAILGLMNASRLRDAAVDARPIFLAVVDQPAPTAPPKPLPPPPATKIPPPPPLTLPLIATEQVQAAPTLAAQVLPPPPPPAPIAPVEAPPAPAPSLAPRTIPAAAVQYLVPPAPVYSRISARMRESGRALVRVWIDEAGLPRNVQLALSTGFARLDDAALAAVRDCRFRPYLENGIAVAGWAAIPIEFELQK
jgi:protein TonB